VNAEIKRRTNVVGIFPNEASALRLVTAVLVEQHHEWEVAQRRYLSEESMALIDAVVSEHPGEEACSSPSRPDTISSSRSFRLWRFTPHRGT
jgi:putative transposase